MTLEYFRKDPIGIPLFVVGDRNEPVDESRSVQPNYIEYSMRAFYLTMMDIQELEYANLDIVPSGRNAVVSSTYWFLALESFLNTLLKLTCIKTNRSFGIYKPKTLTEKLTGLLDLLQIDSVPIKKSGLYSRISEFSTFRNELLHDRNTGQLVKFSKTMFCPIPIQCNLIDVLQGLRIYLETALILRYAIVGLDTMPDILINEKKKVFHKKLDFLYKEVIEPSMTQILKKHNLVTNLILTMPEVESIKSSVFSGTDAAAYRISDSPDIFKFQLSKEITNFSYGFFDQIVESEDVKPGSFKMGSYTLNK